jgi:hypothetical protein
LEEDTYRRYMMILSAIMMGTVTARENGITVLLLTHTADASHTIQTGG